MLKAKQYTFQTGDRISLKIAQAELKACVRKCKEDYKNKIQAQVKQNNTKQAWHSVKSILGCNKSNKHCFASNLSVKNREKLNRIYTISCKIATCCTPDTSLEQLYKSRTLQMATKILSDPTHFLHDHYDLLPSGRRYRMPTVKTQ